MWLARWASTCRSVSTKNPRLTLSPSRPAISPNPKAPAYHSGFSREGRAPSSSSRWRVHAKWSPSSTLASINCWRKAGSWVLKACAAYSAWAHTSPTWLTRISAPASSLSGADSLVASPATVGQGRLACGLANKVRSALSAPLSKLSVGVIALDIRCQFSSKKH